MLQKFSAFVLICLLKWALSDTLIDFSSLKDCAGKSDGFYPFGPCDEKFYSCKNGSLEHHFCPESLWFNSASGFCEEVDSIFPEWTSPEVYSVDKTPSDVIRPEYDTIKTTTSTLMPIDAPIALESVSKHTLNAKASTTDWEAPNTSISIQKHRKKSKKVDAISSDTQSFQTPGALPSFSKQVELRPLVGDAPDNLDQSPAIASVYVKKVKHRRIRPYVSEASETEKKSVDSSPIVVIGGDELSEYPRIRPFVSEAGDVEQTPPSASVFVTKPKSSLRIRPFVSQAEEPVANNSDAAALVYLSEPLYKGIITSHPLKPFVKEISREHKRSKTSKESFESTKSDSDEAMGENHHVGEISTEYSSKDKTFEELPYVGEISAESSSTKSSEKFEDKTFEELPYVGEISTEYSDKSQFKTSDELPFVGEISSKSSLKDKTANEEKSNKPSNNKGDDAAEGSSKPSEKKKHLSQLSDTKEEDYLSKSHVSNSTSVESTETIKHDRFLFPFTSVLTPQKLLKKPFADDFNGKPSNKIEKSKFAPLQSRLEPGHDGFKTMLETTNFKNSMMPKPVPRLHKKKQCPKTHSGCTHTHHIRGCQSHYVACVKGRPIRRHCALGMFFNAHTEFCERREWVKACTLKRVSILASNNATIPYIQMGIEDRKHPKKHQSSHTKLNKISASAHAYKPLSPEDEGFCSFRSDGFYRHPQNCSRIFQCFEGDVFEYPSCPDNQAFDEEKSVCDYSSTVKGCENAHGGVSEAKSSDDVCATQKERNAGDRLANENDCSTYYRCVWGKKVLMHCPDGTMFNREINVCDYKARVNCAGEKATKSS